MAGIPMYARIQHYIKHQIESGSWEENAMIPTEHELMERFGVSRITVTTALKGLVAEGIIYRVQGKGSFVSPRSSVPGIFDLANTFSVANSLESMQVPGEHRCYDFSLIHPDEEVSEVLNLKSDQKAYRVSRVKYVQDKPLVAEHLYYPEAYCSSLPVSVLKDEHISAVLKESNIDVGKSVSFIEPVLCSKEMAGVLDLKEGSPVIRVSLEVYNTNKDPVALAEIYNYGKQRYIFTFQTDN